MHTPSVKDILAIQHLPLPNCFLPITVEVEATFVVLLMVDVRILVCYSVHVYYSTYVPDMGCI